MRIFNASSTHPSFFRLITRVFKILWRYGLSSKKMESNLKLYLAILQKYGVPPSFSIPGNVLSKHHSVIKDLADNGVEFAIHGYDHIDYTRLSHEQLSQHLEKAIKIFRENNIPFLGFRFPYLRYNNKGVDILGNFFRWDSSDAIFWNILEKTKFGKRSWRNYQHALNQYSYKNSDNCKSLPRFCSNILEIPVSLPDDDLLIDRLGVKDKKALAQIWGEILKATYIRGELFVLQLHPERISFYKETLKNLLKTAHVSEPKIWVTSLNSIYEWWNEKHGFSVEINKNADDEYEIHAHCSKRATILFKTKDIKDNKVFNGYSVIDKNTITIRSCKRPIIGISKYSSPHLMQFLKNEGFIFEVSQEKENYSVYLGDFADFSEKNEMGALEIIHSTDSPLVRFWRWPNGCRSAVAITGDIDCLTCLDFFPRLFYR